MRNPYHVGRWVRGRNHYGRRMLIESLLASHNNATWLVGTRRLGKTSILRQLELITLEWLSAGGDLSCAADGWDVKSKLIPLYLDLQGCETPDDLAYELELALEDRRSELAKLGIQIDGLPVENAVAVLRTLARQVSERQARILLLVDEAEALLSIAANDARWLGALRKALLEGHIRTILTSTRLLSRLNHLNAAWSTSPFLFGFHLVNLWALGPEMATALIRQTQSLPVQVNEGVVAQILAYCNGHPYLIQYLCERLFVEGKNGEGMLRPIQDADLQVDHLLAGFFLVDFRNMTKVERRILLTLCKLTLAAERELLSVLYDIPPARLRMFLYALSRLGYVRNIKNQWALGNEFLRRWLLEAHDDLLTRLDSVLDEAEEEMNLRNGVQDEAARLRAKILELEEELAELRRRLKNTRSQERARLLQQIDALEEELVRLRRALDRTDQAHHTGN